MCSVEKWLVRPLCRRYVAVVLSTSLIPFRGSTGRPRAVRWALGSLIDGEVEVLGAWPTESESGPAPELMFGELQARGAEFIRFGVGHLVGVEDEFTRLFGHGDVVASIECELESVLASVPPRYRLEVSRHLRAAADAATQEAGLSQLAEFQGSRLGERYPEVVRHWSDALAGFEPIYRLHPRLRGLVRSADRTAADMRERLTRAILRHGPFVDSDAALAFVADTLLRTEQRLDRARAAALAARQAAQASVAAGPAPHSLAVPTLA